MRLADLLRRDDGDTPAALAAAVARAEDAGRDAVTRLEALNRRRAELLMADDEPGLDAVERDIALATRDLDRSKLALAELNHRLARAQDAEAQAQRDAVHARGEAAQARYAELVRGPYAKAVKALLPVAAELAACAAAVAETNTRLAVLGDDRRLGDPDELARPQRGAGIRVLQLTVPEGLRLPDPEDGGRLAYPAQGAADLPPARVLAA